MGRLYYSLVQYCPDLGRAEAANVGIVVFAPDSGDLSLRFVERNERAVKLFGYEAVDAVALNHAKDSLKNLLSADRSVIRDLQSFVDFSGRLANSLALTKPRIALGGDSSAAMEILFKAYVGEESERKSHLRHKSKGMKDLLARLRRKRAPIKSNIKVPVENLPPLRADFAWLNGHLNVVKAHGISPSPEKAGRDATELGYINKKFAETNQIKNVGRRLIVVPNTEQLPPGPSRDYFFGILNDFEVQVVNDEDLRPLEERIMDEARDFTDEAIFA